MHVFRPSPPTQLGRSSSLRRGLEQAENPDIYHLHGTWLRAMYYGAVQARKRKLPYVVELMGMYEHWCLRHKWLRKQVARLWFQDRVLRDASCLHVNSFKEAEQLQALGFERPVAVIPVGVNIDLIAERLTTLKEDEWHRKLAQRPFVLYLSRLHPKKGLHLLLHAWAKLPAEFSDWQLVIAGTGEPAYVDSCQQLAAQLGIAGRCYFAGHVDELQKTWLYTNAHCYVLPTYSENFGNAVAEALAHRTPVITTTNTPWSDLRKFECGWQVDCAENDLLRALEESLHMTSTARRSMGENGEQLVRQKYSLTSVAKDMLALYDWLLGNGSEPDCLVHP